MSINLPQSVSTIGYHKSRDALVEPNPKHQADAQQSQPVQETQKSEDISADVAKVKDFVQNISRDLQFSIDEDNGDTIIKVLDAETKEVIRQIPTEEIVELAKKLDVNQGVFFNQKI